MVSTAGLVPSSTSFFLWVFLSFFLKESVEFGRGKQNNNKKNLFPFLFPWMNFLLALRRVAFEGMRGWPTGEAGANWQRGSPS